MTGASLTTSPPARAPKVRLPHWDNARFLAVTLVVIGHGIQRLTYDSNNALALYLFIYAFHMPAFAIISGYFSKPGPPSALQMRRVLTDILLPYFIMEAIWSIVKFFAEGTTDLNPSKPSWTLWFLLALGIFRLVLPYLALLRWPLLWAIIGSVGVGYFDNVDSTFSLSRAIGILPFFVLGWKLNEWKLMERWKVAERSVLLIRALAVTIFFGWIAIILSNIELWRTINLRFWFFYDDSYQGLGEDQWWAGAVRLGLIALAILLSAAFFALVPRRHTWIADAGQATMYVYLLHSFILYPLRESGLLLDERSSAMWLVSMVLGSIGIALVLSTPLIKKIFRPIIEPKPNWVFVPLPKETDLSTKKR
ncbi:acyltransferase family protein [Salinibacterium sp. NG253]|uniref:acyltransferase family protein n=1 Tax=Salinibacterium sp. NG253 TaxID=2792039 RepID=UPI0018CEE82D|nr:acyltransferase family protein [Salinibacterium sp. NG253]MBH0117767.1 acyltransferase family protein [Salinibacterium sp. NG253]